MLNLILTIWGAILIAPLSPVEVTHYEYNETQERGVSCHLLKHRDQEREKVIREYLHINSNHKIKEFRTYFELNTFITNQYFLEQSAWQDELIEAKLDVAVSTKLEQAILKQGFDKIFFSVKGVGVNWASYPTNFPADFKIKIDQNLTTITMSYLIYRSDLCFLKAEAPQVSWSEEAPDKTSVAL